MVLAFGFLIVLCKLQDVFDLPIYFLGQFLNVIRIDAVINNFAGFSFNYYHKLIILKMSIQDLNFLFLFEQTILCYFIFYFKVS